MVFLEMQAINQMYPICRGEPCVRPRETQVFNVFSRMIFVDVAELSLRLSAHSPLERETW
jgi:hypothetical protein